MSHITEHALQASLKRLLSIKPLNKITINDIAEDCGINRMTFYYHFRDIYDLVEWSCREDASAALSGNVTRNAWPQALLRIFVSMRENKALVMNIYRGVSREHAERYLDKEAYKLIKTVFEEDADNPWSDEETRIFVARLYAYALTGVILDWIRDGMAEDPELIVSRLSLAARSIPPDRSTAREINQTTSSD